MKKHIEIPHKWAGFRNNPGYFITYFGEIYFGRIWELPEYNDRFFIIQNDKIETIQRERTLENYQKNGREIKDINIIKDVFREHIGNEIKFKQISYGEQEFKKMFVFGAAASSFCVFGNPLTDFRKGHLNPPTGFEIFDEKYNSFISKYPGAKLSIPLFESKNKDIEECMEEEWQIFKNSYTPTIALKHINIQFYLQSLFKAISKDVVENHYRNNLYNLFLTKIQRHISSNQSERISLVSFNYDTIIDDFISQIYRYSFKNMNDYINWDDRNILLFKPHGSCNWGWKLKQELLNGNTQESIPDFLYNNEIQPWEIYFKLMGNINEVIAQNTWGHEYFNDKHTRGRFTINKNLISCIPDKTTNVFFPSLLIPYRDKDEMVMPYDHFNAMKTVIGKIEELYLIGWKGNEDLFNKQFKLHSHNLKKIIIINPQSDIVKNNISKHIDISKIDIIPIKDFETFVLNHLDNYLK